MGQDLSTARTCGGLWGAEEIPKPAKAQLDTEQSVSTSSLTAEKTGDKKQKKKKKKTRKSRSGSDSTSALSKSDLSGLGDGDDDKYDHMRESFSHARGSDQLKLTWPKTLTEQFDIPIEQCHTTRDSNYAGEIPTVLIKLKQFLIRRGGHMQDAIFRTSPAAPDFERALQEVQDGKLSSHEDHHVYATLLKKWFVRLPKRILDGIDPAALLEAKDKPDGIAAIVRKQMRDPQQSTFLWLLDLLVDVSNFHRQNSMTIRTLSVVWAPNLYTDPDPSVFGKDPAHVAKAAMSFASDMTQFLYKATEWRQKNRPSHMDTLDNFATIDDMAREISVSTSVSDLKKEKKKKKKRK